MNTWSFIDADDRPTGQTFTGPAHALEANTPLGCRAVEGVLQAERREDSEMRRARTLARIEALERRQARPMRELQIDPDNTAARDRLASIDADIASLRQTL